MNYSWAKIFLSLMSITMLELCSYGQKRQLYSINIEHCPRENDTPFHRNLWLTCYHDLRIGVLFQAVWLIHILQRFINQTILYQKFWIQRYIARLQLHNIFLGRALYSYISHWALVQCSSVIDEVGYTMIITQSNCLKLVTSNDFFLLNISLQCRHDFYF